MAFVYVQVAKPSAGIVIMTLVHQEQKRKNDFIIEPQSSQREEVRLDGWVNKMWDFATRGCCLFSVSLFVCFILTITALTFTNLNQVRIIVQ